MLTVAKDNVAVVPVGAPDQTEGGLWIPDIAKKRANQGVVKYVGSNVEDIRVGDYVLFSGYTGTTVRLGGGEGLVIIMNKNFVNAKIDLGDSIEVPGLYYYSKKDDIFFTATYEGIVPLIAQAMEEFGQKMKVVTPNPTVEEYNSEL